MRRKLIAANWKMNLDRKAAVALAEAVAREAEKYPKVDLAVCPPACYLDAVGPVLRGSKVALGAQNVYFEANGAFTGEISTSMLQDLGVKYVILGHSERRHILGETDRLINKKVLATLQAGMLPILCVGELLAERETNRTHQVVQSQIDGSLADVSADEMGKIVIAYEPVWAIGTGQVATPKQAEEVHATLRKLLAQRYNDEIAQRVTIQYGGSVKPENAKELLGIPDIDGALVGGASLKVEPFMGIVAGA